MRTFTSCFRPLLLSAALLLGACAETAHHPDIQLPAASAARMPGTAHCSTTATHPVEGSSTPEVSANPPYRLHYLEFDDQGWPFTRPGTAPGVDDQVDCAIADLVASLEGGNGTPGQDVLMLVYVHGWHHTADSGDRDVRRFRELLANESRREAAKPADRRREVLGFYVGWNGESIEFPGVRQLTFWGRKNAAHHVSEGSVREFFARVKALRDHYNRPSLAGDRAKNCGSPDAATQGRQCPLRTVMIGHSFGAWILYSATAPYLMETLAGSSQRDIKVKVPRTQRERGIADLVVLLNPAFEASRYEPLQRAAARYVRDSYEPPLLVSLTSSADAATGVAFPLARFFNTLFQYPATSDEESEAMRRTPGHMERYLTHTLDVDNKVAPGDGRHGTAGMACSQAESGLTPAQMRERFFRQRFVNGEQLRLERHWVRPMCGGLVLRSISDAPYSVVWNVRTSREIIPDHNEVTTPAVFGFVEQVYEEVAYSPRYPIAPD